MKFMMAHQKDKIDSPVPTSAKKLYYRTPHEMSAYFVVAINNLEFFNKKGILRDFRTLYSEFKDVYQGYKYLTPKDKKDLDRKFSQYYYKTKEDDEQIKEDE
jgi:hypothetical protein